MMKGFWKLAISAGFICASLASAQTPANQQAAAADFTHKIDALPWVHGPNTVPIGDEADVRIPKGMRYLGPTDTSKFLQLNGNPPTDRAYAIAPEGPGWFSILEFDPAGYVSDKEKIDPDALFKALKSQEDGANAQRKSLGQSALHLDRWLTPPHYDVASHNLEWGTVIHSDAGEQIVNYTSRILGRDGVTKAILISDPTNFSADLPQYRAMLSAFAYRPTKTYEAHQPGDKLAEYGLGALVAGGAAAAVVKSGLFAGLFAALLKFGVAFYKLIIIGVVGLYAGLRKRIARLFGRSPPDDNGQG
jgi:uncharacterized membrane-anchored protein